MSAANSVPYIALLRRTYMFFPPFPSYITYFPYISLSISNIASTISFYKITITSSSMSSVRNAPGAPITATSRPSVASVDAGMSTDSFAAVGKVMSDLFDPDLCFRLSATARPFIFLHHFCFKRISTRSAPCFWLLVSCLPLI